VGVACRDHNRGQADIHSTNFTAPMSTCNPICFGEPIGNKSTSSVRCHHVIQVIFDAPPEGVATGYSANRPFGRLPSTCPSMCEMLAKLESQCQHSVPLYSAVAIEPPGMDSRPSVIQVSWSAKHGPADTVPYSCRRKTIKPIKTGLDSFFCGVFATNEVRKPTPAEQRTHSMAFGGRPCQSANGLFCGGP
jgi:hypothetical protein